MDFKKDAEAIRSWIKVANRRPLAASEWEMLKPALQRALELFFRLDMLRRDLDASDPEDDVLTEKMGRELAAILGLRCRN